jgi:hypothetical protein
MLVAIHARLQVFLICLLLHGINISLLLAIEHTGHGGSDLVKECFIVTLILLLLVTAAPLLVECFHLRLLLFLELLLGHLELAILFKILVEHDLLEPLPLDLLIVLILEDGLLLFG